MSGVAQVLAVATAEIGYVETGGRDGKSGNLTKYWSELMPQFQGQSWCGAFVSWVFKQAGCQLPAIDHDFGFTYCPDAVNYAKARGLWSVLGHYAPGDVVFYCWNGSGVAEHTGIVESDDGSTLVAIEGNTTPDGLSGSQSNGGCVARKRHPHGPTVLGALQASRLIPATTTSEEDGMYMIRTPDGEIDLVVGKTVIHLDGAGYDFYNKQGVPLRSMRQQDGVAVRSAK